MKQTITIQEVVKKMSDNNEDARANIYKQQDIDSDRGG